jgi:hypothetical protein
VLDVLGPGEHLDLDVVATRVRRRLGKVSTQAIYDVLGALDGAGLVRRVEPMGSSLSTGDESATIIITWFVATVPRSVTSTAPPVRRPASNLRIRGLPDRRSGGHVPGTCPQFFARSESRKRYPGFMRWSQHLIL